MSTRPLNPKAIIVTECGTPLPVKNPHIDIAWDYATGADYTVKWNLRRMIRIVDTTATVLPLEEEESK